jgi:hypothetical protein
MDFGDERRAVNVTHHLFFKVINDDFFLEMR